MKSVKIIFISSLIFFFKNDNCFCQCIDMLNGSLCNDNNPCTINDVCVNGVCQGIPKNCNDGNACTNDFCDSFTGECYYVNNNSTCNDGNACTINDQCINGVCISGALQICDDSNPCTDDACNPATGCVYINDDSNACDDGNICTIGDFCSNGICVGGFLTSCPDDSNPCTTSGCHPSTGCYLVNNSNTCDDGNPCTYNDICTNGICQGVLSSSALFVTNKGNDGIGTLRNIILNSCNGDTIFFDIDTCYLSTPINIAHSLIIKGNGVASTVINGQLLSRAFNISDKKNLYFHNISFINCKSTANGGAFYNEGTVTLNFVNFINNFEGSSKKAFTSSNEVIITNPGTVKIFD